MKALLPAIVLAAGLLSASCSMPDSAADLADRDEEPDAVFIGFSREEVEDGIVTFSAKAERAEYFRDKGMLVVYKVAFEDRGEDGESLAAVGEADKVVYHEDTGDAEFSGFVQIRSIEEDATFETTELKYFSATETIEGAFDNPVIVKVGKKLFLHGAGFFADIREKAFAFRNGVQGTLIDESAVRNAKGEE